MTTLNNEEKNAVRLNDHIITEDGVIVNINDIPTVSRWYDKWSNINDEDGVVNRSASCLEFEDEFNINGEFKKQSGRLYHWKGYSWKTIIERKATNNNKRNDDDDDNDDGGDNGPVGTSIHFHKFAKEFSENIDIIFRYILVHRNHAGLSIGVSEMQLKHPLRRKKYCDGLVKSIDFAWGNDLYDKSRGYADGFGNVIIRCSIEILDSAKQSPAIVPFLTWREAKEKYENNKQEIERLKRINESKRQQKVAEKASLELLRKVGNQFFMDKRYEEAVTAYSRAINTEEGALSAILYSNRSAAYLNLGRKEDALNDALLARQLSFSRWPKAYFRVAKAKYELGIFTDAYQAADVGINLAQSILQCQDRHVSDLKCTKGDMLELFALKSKAMKEIEAEMFTYDSDIKQDTTVSTLDEPKNGSDTAISSESIASSSESDVVTAGDKAIVGAEEQQELQADEVTDKYVQTDSNNLIQADPVQALLANPSWNNFLSMMDQYGPSVALKWAETDAITSMLMQELKDLMSKQGKKVDFLSARSKSESESKSPDEYVNNNINTYLPTSVTVLTQHYEYDDGSFGETKTAAMDSPQYIVNSKKQKSELNPYAKEFKPSSL